MFSYESNSKSNNVGDNSDDIEIEHNEEFKQAELSVISSFVEKRNLELSILNEKYDS